MALNRRPRRPAIAAGTAALLLATAAFAQITIHDDHPLFVTSSPFTIAGTAAAGQTVTVSIDRQSLTATADAHGAWQVRWTAPLPTGTYVITATADGATATQLVRVLHRGRLPRQPEVVIELRRYDATAFFDTAENIAVTDRWRIVPPPYELDEASRGKLDPYNKNVLKGDYPIRGNDTFLVLTAISDTLSEVRTLPTPSGPEKLPFFGRDRQGLVIENLLVSADLYQGDTTFQPVRQRIKATIAANFNRVRVGETGLVKPDVRRGTKRHDEQLAIQELFYERKLRDLSVNYDFVSVRAGSQPFSSDFRGFVFTDTNLGIRLFGNYASNRFQYNIALFDRLEKDTNSGLNIISELRDQRVGVANIYWQDFVVPGYTQEFSIHRVVDDGGTKYDRNGILVRPAPIGEIRPHEIRATYLGEAGAGHVGRINIDQAIYYVFGHDSLNPIAGPDPLLRNHDKVQISAGMAAIEVSYDRDWLRPRFALFYASGDRDPRNRTARGFDSIVDSPAFAGGGFSFFNRLGIPLAGTGVSLVERGSLLPALRTSKEEGQPNYVNPGLQLASAGLDIDVTPRLKMILTGNYIRLDAPQPVEELLFQGAIHKTIGTDLSAGFRYRPLLSNNWIFIAGAGALLPGAGFRDIYERDKALYHVFTDVVLQF